MRFVRLAPLSLVLLAGCVPMAAPDVPVTTSNLVSSSGAVIGTVRVVAGLLVPGARLTGRDYGTGPIMHDYDGTSLVIHAKADDEKTDPSGNSGDRIACAIL